MIRAEKFSFGFDDTELYKEIDFTLADGCHCALIGSNGTGKTTLVNIIRNPEDYLYTGKLIREDIGRIGYASQFAVRDKAQDITVFEYLSEDFLLLANKTEEICNKMGETDDLDSLLEEYQALLDESQAIDADNYEVNIERQLRLAELDDKKDLELGKLSGGEYKLVQVIRQMLRRPGLLIMDEPDVFLDFENLNGLRDLINAYEGTLLVVTHSRFLLAHCFDKIWHLENADLQEFEGSFAQYQYTLLQKKIDLMERANKDAAEIERTEIMVERLRDEATEVIDPMRGRTLKGKVSYLGRLLARQIKMPFVEIRHPKIRLPEAEDVPSENALLEVKDYNLAFENELLTNVSFEVMPFEKVALVGPNGTGKTSMLREIWKSEKASIKFSEEAEVGFFSQLQEETLNENNSIYREMYDIGFETPKSVEDYLIEYCFNPETLDRKISKLSGGEKNLLQLAKLAVGKSNILLLDEPSSHLDTYAQIELEKAIKAYKGAILMVSHDFYSIVNCADRILLVDDGTVRPMSARAFRKMIYKHHFSLEYLELEQKKQDLETRIAAFLEQRDCESAKVLCDELGAIIDKM